jgi:hypothetical protein
VVWVETASIQSNESAFQILKNPSLPKDMMQLTGLLPIMRFLYMIWVIPLAWADLLKS